LQGGISGFDLLFGRRLGRDLQRLRGGRSLNDSVRGLATVELAKGGVVEQASTPMRSGPAARSARPASLATNRPRWGEMTKPALAK